MPSNLIKYRFYFVFELKPEAPTGTLDQIEQRWNQQTMTIIARAMPVELSEERMEQVPGHTRRYCFEFHAEFLASKQFDLRAEIVDELESFDRVYISQFHKVMAVIEYGHGIPTRRAVPEVAQETEVA